VTRTELLIAEQKREIHLDPTKRPRKWVCILTGILLFAIVPPFFIGFFRLDPTGEIVGKNSLALIAAGAGAGWLWWKAQQRG
jgi:hypothetical protein